MLVCSLWATLIKSTPKLWALVDEGCPDRLFLIIGRSNSVPLTVEKHYMGVHPDLDDALFKESYRWESIRVMEPTLDDLPQRLGLLGISILPALKHLSIISEQDSLPTPAWNFVECRTPKLESLRLVRCLPAPESLLLDNLRVLELKHVISKADMLPSLLHLLQQCQRLDVLHLEDLKFGHSPSTTNLPEVVVLDFPSLKKFHISQLYPEDTARIISAVRMPCCTEITIHDFKVQTQQDFPTRNDMPDLIATLGSVLGVAQHVMMGYRWGWFNVVVFSEGRNIFDFCGKLGCWEEPLQVFDIALADWGLPEINVPTEIRFNLYFGDLDIEPNITILRTLPYVVTIVLLEAREQMVLDILQLLGEPYEAADGMLPQPGGHPHRRLRSQASYT